MKPALSGFWIGLRPLQSSPPTALGVNVCGWAGALGTALCATAGRNVPTVSVAAASTGALSILALNNRLPRSGRISYLFSRWLPTRNTNHLRSFFTGHPTRNNEEHLPD